MVKSKKNTTTTKQSWMATLDDNCEPRADYLLISKDCSKDQKQRDEFQQKYQTCAANFPGTNNDKKMGPYDIRKHKQYNLLLESIQREYSVKKRDPNAPPTPTCVPFQTTDIRTHKDYPKMVQYIYEMASKKFSDITKNPNYDKVVADIQQKTLLKCPKPESVLAATKIQQHPQYNQLVQSVVKKTMKDYGDPIPGSNPVAFQKCSTTVNSCLQKFKPGTTTEGFFAAAGPAAAAPTTAAAAALNRIDPFDIKNHTQYRTLLATWQKECDARVVAVAASTSTSTKTDRGDITTHPDINRYVLKASLPTKCQVEEGFLAASAAGAGASATESVADIKDASAKVLNMKILDKPSTKAVADIYHSVVAVERGQQKLSDLVINGADSPPIVQDLQKMLGYKVEIATNQKMIDKIQKKTAKSIERFETDTDADYSSYILENKLGAAKAVIDNYAFKNARLREELKLLRKMCNERIMNLWNEAQSLRHKQKERERALRHKEASLKKTQANLEARDLRISEQQRTQQDKFIFFNSQLNLYRSVSERYKQELDALKKTIQTQSTQNDQQMSRTQDMCAQRVEQYRKMYEQTLVLLQELRAKAAEKPAVSDKINQIQGSLTQAVRNGGSDAQVLGAFAKAGRNMTSLEESIQESNNTAEDLMWYNNSTNNYAAAF